MKIDPALYSQIVRDERISHGAHRLWCLLRDMTGNNPCAWPSVNSICKSIHCGKDAAFGWIIELEAAGYMRVERGNQHKSNRYYLNGGSVQNRRGPKAHPPSGSKSGYELNPVIQSKNSGRAACVKAQPPALPEAKKGLRASDASLLSLVANLYAANK